MDPLKNALVNAIEIHLREDAAKSGLLCEVHRVDSLVVQVKVWEGNGPPRYLNVRVSEMM